jgi:manganese oxidase
VSESPNPPAAPRPTNFMMAAGATCGFLALALSVFALLFWFDSGDDSVAAGAGAATTTHVALSEFAIDPAPITVAAGGTLHVENSGTVAHNLSIEHTDLKTPDIAAGESAELAIGDLAPGDYTVACLIPGHADAGMRAPLTVTEGGAASGDATATTDHSAHGGAEMDYAQMEQDMVASMSAFPAETAGVGNAVLEPSEVLPDGTKVFDIVAAITDWERAPGDVVQAWTYNGTVPAPSIHLAVGDHAQFRLTNNLPIATDLHLHGLNVDNQFDGVAPFTQDPIEPGETFTYEYFADEVSVAMYHPHFMSQIGMPNGLFGTIFVGDEPLPLGQTVGGEAVPADLTVSQQIPMVLNDSGVIGYSLNGKSFPATAPVVAAVGDWIEVTYFNEGTQVHPMHLHQFDQIVIGKDGFPLDHPYVADVVTVAPGERYTVLVHLDKPGTWVWHCHILPHVEDDSGMFGMVTAVVVQ